MSLGKQLETLWKREWERSTPHPMPKSQSSNRNSNASRRAAQLSETQRNELKALLDEIFNHPMSNPFLEPVDWKSLGLLDYPKIIKKPMDFGTVRKKLESGDYKTPKAFDTDMRLVTRNCIKYNAANSDIAQWAVALETVYIEQWRKLLPNGNHMNEDVASESGHSIPIVEAAPSETGSLPVDKPRSTVFWIPTEGEIQLKDLQTALKTLHRKLMSHKSAFWFRSPVDPIAQNVPTYFDVIKSPMDLGTIGTKLRQGEYVRAQEYDHDFRLMVSNCHTFNGAESEPSLQANKLMVYYEKHWIDLFSKYQVSR